jgi:thymidine kinase
MKLTLILGTMYAGKSAYALRNYHNYTFYIPKFTDRGYLSRDTEAPSDVKVVYFDDFLPELHDRMVIDEGQFLNDVNVDNIINCNEDYHIVVVSLNSKGYVRGSHDEWQQVSNLLPHASEIIHLQALCSACHKENAVTHVKLPFGGYIGSQQYKVLCHRCLAKIRKAEEQTLYRQLRAMFPEENF